MNKKEVTVDQLLKLFQNLTKSGYGDMRIKCSDNYLHEDEIGVNYASNEVQFRGFLFNVPITPKINKFCDDIEKARRAFYDRSEIN